ncbi:hypothetical protein [Streptomyces sp. bgisy100]|uniref:hypothetical protein n=1 Tax=Streptomyces sp. bgisy100 TaxID=3413783 RepID=UPI003D71B1EA
MTLDQHPDPARTSVSYSLVLPPGWSKIPLRSNTDEAVRDIAKRAFANISDDVPPDEVVKYRTQLEGQLLRTAAQAADHFGVDLYLATEPRGGVVVPASFIVSELQLAGSGHADPGDVVRQLAQGEGQQVTLGEVSGTRAEYVTGAAPDRGIGEAARHVDYVLPVPGEVGRWLTLAFSTPADGDAKGVFADLLVELFDAIMSTFRWSEAD